MFKKQLGLRAFIKLLALGSAAGLFLGILASRVLAFIVYSATPRDPLVLAGVVLAMALLGLLATWIPAKLAGRLISDPWKRGKIGQRQEGRVDFLHQFAFLFRRGFHCHRAASRKPGPPAFLGSLQRSGLENTELGQSSSHSVEDGRFKRNEASLGRGFSS